MPAGQETTRLPVRSALFKQRTGGLVVRWVTTSEYPLLYVSVFFSFFAYPHFVTRQNMDGYEGKKAAHTSYADKAAQC
jgi:hypothetical protein